jgi:hypothetical protein
MKNPLCVTILAIVSAVSIAAIFSDFQRNLAQFLCDPDCVAEREGFEPTVRF